MFFFFVFFDLILKFAENDRRIRGVIMNGSRANPQAQRDTMQDYDIVYLVDDFESFMADHSWVDVFGEKLVHQLPDDTILYPDSVSDGRFGYLMQFADGNRIYLTVAKKELYKGFCFDDRLSVILLDKDNFLPELPPPDESSHYVKVPDINNFNGCRCEFWWVSPYVSKGLWRGLLLFAQQHMELCIRKELGKMLSWYAASLNDFNISTGKCGDKLKEYLPNDMWQKYLSTWAACDESAVWDALFAAGELFSQTSRLVAEKLNFAYDDSWDKNVPKYLEYVRNLPRDAETIEFTL